MRSYIASWASLLVRSISFAADHVRIARNDAGIVVLLEHDHSGGVLQSDSQGYPYFRRDLDPQLFRVREAVFEILDLGTKHDRVPAGIRKVMTRIGPVGCDLGEDFERDLADHDADRRGQLESAPVRLVARP